MRLPSPAKLNLFLYINGRREDGYHELQTLFQFIDFCDYITFTEIDRDEIIIENPLANVDLQDNLIYKAAKILKDYTKCKKGISFFIEKNLPLGGGVGGGSSNAATVLVGLNYLWQLGLSLDELATLGVKLGADVPVFVKGKAAFAQGIGEQLTFCQPKEKYYLVAKPDVSISTAELFQDPNLPRNTPKRPLDELLEQTFSNDFENILCSQNKRVERLRNLLLKYAPTRLTGTGACIFAEFNEHSNAEMVLEVIKKQKYFAFIAKGANVSPLHQTISNYPSTQNLEVFNV